VEIQVVMEACHQQRQPQQLLQRKRMRLEIYVDGVSLILLVVVLLLVRLKEIPIPMAICHRDTMGVALRHHTMDIQPVLVLIRILVGATLPNPIHTKVEVVVAQVDRVVGHLMILTMEVEAGLMAAI
jgi:hypothetical protein